MKQSLQLKICAVLFCLSWAPLVKSEPDPESTAKINALLKEQFEREQAKLKRAEIENAKRLADLEILKTKAIRESLALAQREAAGFAQFMSFIHLIKVRYSDQFDQRNAEFLKSSEITPEDVKSINQLFSTYLNRTPLSGRVSAGLAVELLESGREDLEKQISLHSKPTDENSSELAIIANDVEAVNRDVKVVSTLFAHLRSGVIPDSVVSTNAPASPVAAAVRAPAAIPSPKR